MDVLICEPNSDDSEHLRRLLAESGAGAGCVEAADLSQALDHVRLIRFDAIFLSSELINQPVDELFGRLRAASTYVPIIMLTTQANESSTAALLGQGADDYLVKEELTRSAVMSAVRHATEQRRTQQLLRETNLRLSYLINQSPDLIFVLDQSLRYVWVPKTAAPFTGEQVLGKTDWDLFPPHDATRLDSINRQVMQTGQSVKYELTIESADGPIHHQNTAQPWRDSAGNVCGVVVYARDVTDQRQALDRYQATFENAAVGIANIALDGRLLRINQRFCDMLGYSRQQMQSLNMCDITPPEDREADHVQAELLFSGKVPSYSMEKRYLCNGGQMIWVHLSASVVRNSAGQVDYAVAVVQDITARKQAEAELEKARAAFEADARAKTHFLAVLSHELRTPLTPVLMIAQVMERDPSVSAEIRELAQVMRRNVEIETRLIDDLLDLTRISRGKLELHLTSVDVHQTILDAVEMCGVDAKHKSLSIQFDFQATETHVHADATRLQQVIWNLLKNGIKFTPPGGTIRFSTSNANDKVRISVSDTGIGMTPELLPHIFNAFEQGGASVTRAFGGLGLGLSIAKGLVELQGGTITASSDGPGKGAMFVLELPLAHEPSDHRVHASTAHISADDAPATAQQRLLLVEDHDDSAQILARQLRVLGYHVQTAANVADAIAATRAGQFDLLIADLGLPDGDGLELMRELHQSIPMPGIVLSGFGSDEDMAKSRAAGFLAHITKPATAEQLHSVIQWAVHQRPSSADAISALPPAPSPDRAGG
jgi:two-component system CheB/CheR fusion protein